MGDSLYLLGLVALTSWLAWRAGRRWARLDKAPLRTALVRLSHGPKSDKVVGILPK